MSAYWTLFGILITAQIILIAVFAYMAAPSVERADP